MVDGMYTGMYNTRFSVLCRGGESISALGEGEVVSQLGISAQPLQCQPSVWASVYPGSSSSFPILFHFPLPTFLLSPSPTPLFHPVVAWVLFPDDDDSTSLLRPYSRRPGYRVRLSHPLVRVRL
jgi:hypothetical protein